MSEQIVMLLVGLYFIGVSLPNLFVNPIQRGTLVQFVFGLVLVILAFIGGVRLI